MERNVREERESDCGYPLIIPLSRRRHSDYCSNIGGVTWRAARIKKGAMTMKRGGTPRVQYRCSFCGKDQERVHRLIAGPGGVYICNECIDLCREIIEEEQASVGHPPPGNAQDAGIAHDARWVSSSGRARPHADDHASSRPSGDSGASSEVRDAGYIDVPKTTRRRCPTRASGPTGSRTRGDARLARTVGERERGAARAATVARGRDRTVIFIRATSSQLTRRAARRTLASKG